MSKRKSNRIGEVKYNNQNEKMTIIAYRSCKDIDVQFEDGTIKKSVKYEAFKNGKISKTKNRRKNKKHRIGETNYNTQNEKMTIIAYRSCRDIDVQFEDGTIRKSVKYGAFKNGQISKNKKTEWAKSKIGETNYNTQNEKMTIIAPRSANDIDIQFEDGTIRKSVKYGAFKNGQISKNKKTECGKSKIGEINYNTQNEKMTIIDYHSFKNIDVQFEDGTIRTNINYKAFQRKNVPKPDKNIRIGECSYNNQNEKMTIIAYHSSKNIDVQFEDGTIRKSVKYVAFKNRQIPKNKKAYNENGTTLIMKNGMPATIQKNERNWNVVFKDTYIVPIKTAFQFYKLRSVAHPLRPIGKNDFPTTINNFYITGIAYRSENPNLYCTCTKCGYSDILTYDEMNEHQCEEPFNE